MFESGLLWKVSEKVDYFGYLFKKNIIWIKKIRSRNSNYFAFDLKDIYEIRQKSILKME